MTKEILQKKMGRYLNGESTPAETRQIQTWLSCTTGIDTDITVEEKAVIETEIFAEVKKYIDYTLTTSPKPAPWWKKITTFF